MNWCRVSAKQCELSKCPFIYWGRNGGYSSNGMEREDIFENIAKECPARYTPPPELAGNPQTGKEV